MLVMEQFNAIDYIVIGPTRVVAFISGQMSDYLAHYGTVRAVLRNSEKRRRTFNF